MSLWPLAIVFAVLGLLLVLYAIGPRIFRGTRPLATALRCPSRRRDVDVVFRVDAWAGDRVDVEQCSEFTPATAVACDKACMRR